MGTAAALASKPGGGGAWLRSLRAPEVSASAAAAALRSLPGVGPKVAACAALFSLDKHDLVPVDTHVWQLAQAHYAHALPPEALAPPPSVDADDGDAGADAADADAGADGDADADAKSPPGSAGGKKKAKKKGDGFTLRRAAAVEAALAALFGPYAGWAQTALFIAELRSQKAALPEHLRTPASASAPSSAAKSTPKRKPTPAGGEDKAAAKKRATKRKLEGGEAKLEAPAAP